jgi:cyclic-di-GMP phosphodiesterase TipF (flagellum assembly factor)
MRMGRLSAIFVAVCMVLIVGSLGAVLYLRFGLSGPESSIVAVAVLSGLALYNFSSGRSRDRNEVGRHLGDPRGTVEVGRTVAEINRRLAAIESNSQAAVDKAVATTKPISAELSELGTLIKQLAETVAEHDAQLNGRAPSSPIPASAADAAPTPAPSAFVETPPDIPAAPPMLASAVAPAAEAPAESTVEAIPAVAAAPAPVPMQIAEGRFKGMEREAVIAMVREAVEADRIDLFLQPIVTLPQRKVRYYEALARLRTADGEQLLAADFLPHAEAAGLMPNIDNLMLFRCVQVIRRLLAKNREIGVFCNMSPSTLADGASFPQFVQFMEANRAIAPALMFEFTQAAYRSMGPIENESLAALAENGFRFSMDGVTDLRIEPRDLAERGFRFVKVPAEVLLSRSGAVTSDIHPADFSGLLSRFGIELIGTMIETEAVVVDLLDYDVKYGQGLLFSPPRPVRPEVMQGIPDRDVIAREPNAEPAPPRDAKTAASQAASPLGQLARRVVARG